jgi:hypothetical protein
MATNTYAATRPADPGPENEAAVTPINTPIVNTDNRQIENSIAMRIHDRS